MIYDILCQYYYHSIEYFSFGMILHYKHNALFLSAPTRKTIMYRIVMLL